MTTVAPFLVRRLRLRRAIPRRFFAEAPTQRRGAPAPARGVRARPDRARGGRERRARRSDGRRRRRRGRRRAGASPVRTVVLLVDMSGSMRADDVKPTRLDATIRPAMRDSSSGVRRRSRSASSPSATPRPDAAADPRPGAAAAPHSAVSSREVGTPRSATGSRRRDELVVATLDGRGDPPRRRRLSAGRDGARVRPCAEPRPGDAVAAAAARAKAAGVRVYRRRARDADRRSCRCGAACS